MDHLPGDWRKSANRVQKVVYMLITLMTISWKKQLKPHLRPQLFIHVSHLRPSGSNRSPNGKLCQTWRRLAVAARPTAEGTSSVTSPWGHQKWAMPSTYWWVIGSWVFLIDSYWLLLFLTVILKVNDPLINWLNGEYCVYIALWTKLIWGSMMLSHSPLTNQRFTRGYRTNCKDHHEPILQVEDKWVNPKFPKPVIPSQHLQTHFSNCIAPVFDMVISEVARF